jgi:transcriptional antiterminator NusG
MSTADATRPTTRFYAVKTSSGQEKAVANYVVSRRDTRDKPVYSILVLDTMKGYILLEADNAQVVNETTAGFKHVKSQVPGMIKFSDIEPFLASKPVITELSIDDVVEVLAGPFKGMTAKVNRVEPARSEVTVVLLDAPYHLQVTVDANFLRIKEKASTAATPPPTQTSPPTS